MQDKIESMVKRPKTGAPLHYDDLFTGYYFVRFKEYLVFFRIEDKRMPVDRILFRKCDHIRILLGSKDN